jgi:hypothetical protein
VATSAFRGPPTGRLAQLSRCRLVWLAELPCDPIPEDRPQAASGSHQLQGLAANAVALRGSRRILLFGSAGREQPIRQCPPMLPYASSRL